MARVVLDQLSKSFPSPNGGLIHAVRELSLVVEDRELLVLVGPSACGKTTLLRLIAGLEEPDAGGLAIDGVAMNRVAPKDRNVAMVFQNHALYPHLTVRENLASGLVWRKFSQSDVEQRVQEVTSLLALDDCLDRRPEQISGGQRQRVALGRALALKPKLFLLDEPLASLDAPMRAHMRSEIKILQRLLGITMIYVTHDQSEALALGDRIAVMKNGAVDQCADARTLYYQPANQFVAGFVVSPAMNFFPGTVVLNAGRLYFRDRSASREEDAWSLVLNDEFASKLAGKEGQAIVLGLRPERLRLAATSENHAEPSVVATVVRVEMLGSETHLCMWREGRGFVVRVPGLVAPAIGEKITISFDWRDAHFFDAATSVALE